MSFINAFTGAIANIAAIDAEYVANWTGARCNTLPMRNTAFVTIDGPAGAVITLWKRTNVSGLSPQKWTPSASGSYTVPAKLTGAGDDCAEARFVIGSECSGLVVHSTVACTVDIVTVDT